MVISHDRWFLDRVATHILAYEGTTRPGQWFWFEGNFESYEKNKVERLGAEAARPHRVDLPQAHPRLTHADPTPPHHCVCASRGHPIRNDHENRT